MADDTVTVRAAPWHALALPQPLDFPPPYAEFSSNPDGFSYWWQLLKFVVDLPDPNAFPPLGGFSNDEQAAILRYVDTCRELAESTVLSHTGGLQLNVAEGKRALIADEPPRESIRGTVVLFRQIASDSEPASYSTVRKIIGRRISENRDGDWEQRDEMQRRWNRARATLMGGMLTSLAGRKVIQERGGHPSLPVPGEDVRPTEILSLFQYGDLIHWDKHRDAMSALQSDDFWMKFRTFQFLQVLIQLSHFYIGYSLLARRALELNEAV